MSCLTLGQGPRPKGTMRFLKTLIKDPSCKSVGALCVCGPECGPSPHTLNSQSRLVAVVRPLPSSLQPQIRVVLASRMTSERTPDWSLEAPPCVCTLSEKAQNCTFQPHQKHNWRNLSAKPRAASQAISPSCMRFIIRSFAFHLIIHSHHHSFSSSLHHSSTSSITPSLHLFLHFIIHSPHNLFLHLIIHSFTSFFSPNFVASLSNYSCQHSFLHLIIHSTTLSFIPPSHHSFTL